MNELYSHKPNTYSYREVNSNIKHIKLCTCVGKLQLHLIIRKKQQRTATWNKLIYSSK
jgi:hypothetical protein